MGQKDDLTRHPQSQRVRWLRTCSSCNYYLNLHAAFLLKTVCKMSRDVPNPLPATAAANSNIAPDATSTLYCQLDFWLLGFIDYSRIMTDYWIHHLTNTFPILPVRKHTQISVVRKLLLSYYHFFTCTNIAVLITITYEHMTKNLSTSAYNIRILREWFDNYILNFSCII